MPSIKKEVRFIVDPVRQQQEEAALDAEMSSALTSSASTDRQRQGDDEQQHGDDDENNDDSLPAHYHRLHAETTDSAVSQMTAMSSNNDVVFTARLPLPLTVRCCSALRNMADMLKDVPSVVAAATNAADSMDASMQESNNNHDNEQRGGAATAAAAVGGEELSSDEKAARQRELDREEIALGATGFLTGGSPTTAGGTIFGGSSSSSISFLSEMPSVLPLHLPFAACSDEETLRLFCEWHAGCDYSRMEVCEVTGWGTANERASPAAGSASAASIAAARAAANANLGRGKGAVSAFFSGTRHSHRHDHADHHHHHHHHHRSSKNKSPKIDPKMRYVHALDNVTSSSSASSSDGDDDDDNNQRPQNGSRPISCSVNTRVEHGVLSALALEDRNPAVIFSAGHQQQQQQLNINNNASSNGGGGVAVALASAAGGGGGLHSVLPQWERQWVQDNFLSLESPACCAKAARVAAMAEFMGCSPLIELMACVIASRLCERHNPSTEHMQWCLSGKMSGFSSD